MNKLFIISATQVNENPWFCWVCKEPLLPGEKMSFCRWADDIGRYERAHADCANNHPDNACKWI